MNVNFQWKTFIRLSTENNRNSITYLLDLLETQSIEILKISSNTIPLDKVEIPLNDDMFPPAPPPQRIDNPHHLLWLLWTTYMLILCRWEGAIVTLKTQYTSDELIANYNLIYDKITTYYMKQLEEL